MQYIQSVEQAFTINYQNVICSLSRDHAAIADYFQLAFTKYQSLNLVLFVKVYHDLHVTALMQGISLKSYKNNICKINKVVEFLVKIRI